MDRLLQEKKKAQSNFRSKINDFVSKSQYARKDNQFTSNTLNDILTTCPMFEGTVNNGKVNLQKLCQKVTANEPHANPKELYKVLGGKKEIKVQDLQQVLKSYQLHQFDMEEQIRNMLFEGDRFSLSKLDGVMSSLSMPGLTPKDRELLVQCFDFDRDGSIDAADLTQLMKLCRSGEESKTVFKS